MDLVWPQLASSVDFARDALEIDVPVHVVAGRADRITGLDQVRPWFEALQAPRKQLEVLDGVGHLSLYEAPDRFVALLDEVRETLPA